MGIQRYGGQDRTSVRVIRSLYSELFDELGADHQRRRIYFHGGRGVGKSTILELLTRDAKEQLHDRRQELVDGKDRENRYERIRDLQAEVDEGEQPVPDVYIDDFDHLLRGLLQSPSEVEAEEMLQHLDFLVVKVPGNGRRFWVSAAASPSRLADLLYQLRDAHVGPAMLDEFFSYFFDQHFEVLRLNPWPADWRQRSRRLVRDSMPDLTPSASAICERTILKLTGGHPALLTGSLSELHRLTTSDELDPLEKKLGESVCGQGTGKELGPLIERHLEDKLTQTGLRPLRQSISWLRNTDRSVEREAYQYLLKMAQETNPTSPPLKFREILQDEGLIYKDRETGAYLIPGSLLCNEILQGAGAEEVEPATVAAPPVPRSLELKADDQGSEDLPDLVVRSGDSTEHVGLADGPRRILQILFEQPERYFAVDELEDRTGMNEGAVRSAIQRLMRKLREAQLDGIIDNAYGRGYRKGTNPTYRGEPLQA